MKLLLVSDAWAPQVNGVVRTLSVTVAMLRARGAQVVTLTPDRFRSVACPTYAEIRLALPSPGTVRRFLGAYPDHAVHIATEGPLGWLARRACMAAGRSFTTSFHTRFPDYLHARWRVPTALSWRVLRRFHAPARLVLTATATLADELAKHGLMRTARWSRGVDMAAFRPGLVAPEGWRDLPRPILLSVGRLAPEKNLDAFLSLETDGSKIIVGDGPQRARLEAAYPRAIFTGALAGEVLARAYAAADAFVFPSRTDTFGLVMIEAMASGVPVAAYPVAGPLDVVGSGGVLDEDLGRAVAAALRVPRAAAAARARAFTWEAATAQFAAAIAGKEPGRPHGLALAIPDADIQGFDAAGFQGASRRPAAARVGAG